MRSKWFSVLSLLLVVILLVSACGATEEPAAQPTQAPETGGEAAQSTEAPAAEEVTLRVLVHQNPPMVEFMDSFNEAFQTKYPNITVDMSVVNAPDRNRKMHSVF